MTSTVSDTLAEMSDLIDRLRTRLNTPERRKFIKYSLVSVISMAVTIVLTLFFYGFVHVNGNRTGFIASTIAAIPSYYLNRNWVWGKSGKSHFKKEVLPFWIMAFIGMGFSALVTGWVDDFAKGQTGAHWLRTIIVSGGPVLAFAILWVIKYVLFNRILFVHREDELDPALDGRTGLPT